MTPLSRLRVAYQRALQLPRDDRPVIDFVAAVVAAFRLRPRADLIWGFVVGPTGCGKTECMLPYENHPRIEVLNTLTDKALVSGWSTGNGDPSFLCLANGQVVLIHDFTSVMSLPRDQRNTIMGDLRGIYDAGRFVKAFGRGTKSFDVRFGLLAGATPDIDRFLAEQSSLGERFVMIRMARNRTDRAKRALQERALRWSHTKEAWRAGLAETVQCVFDELPTDVSLPGPIDQSPEVRNVLMAAAALVAKARTPALRSGLVAAEEPLRLQEQLYGLTNTRAYLAGREKWIDDDLAFLRRVATDSVPLSAVRILRRLARSSRPRTAAELQAGLIFPLGTFVRAIQQYKHAGLIETDPTGKGLQLTEATRADVTTTELFVQ